MHPHSRLSDLATLTTRDHEDATRTIRDLLAQVTPAIEAAATAVRRSGNMTEQCHQDARSFGDATPEVQKISDAADQVDALAAAADQLEDALAALRLAYDRHATDDEPGDGNADVVELNPAPTLTPTERARARRNVCILCGFSEYDHPKVDAGHPFTPKD